MEGAAAERPDLIDAAVVYLEHLGEEHAAGRADDEVAARARQVAGMVEDEVADHQPTLHIDDGEAAVAQRLDIGIVAIADLLADAKRAMLLALFDARQVVGAVHHAVHQSAAIVAHGDEAAVRTLDRVEIAVDGGDERLATGGGGDGGVEVGRLGDHRVGREEGAGAGDDRLRLQNGAAGDAQADGGHDGAAHLLEHAPIFHLAALDVREIVAASPAPAEGAPGAGAGRDRLSVLRIAEVGREAEAAGFARVQRAQPLVHRHLQPRTLHLRLPHRAGRAGGFRVRITSPPAAQTAPVATNTGTKLPVRSNHQPATIGAAAPSVDWTAEARPNTAA